MHKEIKNPFLEDTDRARLVRHSRMAYDKYMTPAFSKSKNAIKKIGRKEKCLERMEKILEESLLRSISSNCITNAVSVFSLWNDGQNPDGRIGKDIVEAYFHTIGVEFSTEVYDKMYHISKVLHWLLYTHWMVQRTQESLIAGNSATVRDLTLVSNTPYFLRPLSSHAPQRVQSPTDIVEDCRSFVPRLSEPPIDWKK